MSQSDNVQTLPNIVIRSEEDAYQILQLALDEKLPEYNQLVFDGWPTLNLYLKGEKFDQSLTPTIMKGLLELQKGVYKSFASANFGNSSKRLTEEEKDELEIKVTVKGGSSSLEINFPDIATKLIDQLGARMDPAQVVIAVVSIAVLYFGTSAYKSYLENRKEVRLREISDETQRHTLDTMRFASEQETKRAELIVSLAKKEPTVDSISHIAHETHTEVVKSLAAGTTSRIDDIPLTPEITTTLTQNARRKSMEVRLDGEYKILKLDWSDPLQFRVKVFNPKTGIHLDAEVHDGSLTGQHKDAIKAAEWSRKLVELGVNAKSSGDGIYRDAVIVSAKLVEPENTEDEIE